MSQMWTPDQDPHIGSWTPADLRRFVVNQILTDPGALPKSVDKTTPLVQAALATPVLRGEAGGTVLAGTATGSYMANMDSTPKLPATLANQVLSLFQWSEVLDAPPPGYRTQWQMEVQYQTNAASPAASIVWGLWQIVSMGGAAGGYVETGSGSFLSSPQCLASLTAANNAITVLSGWSDHGSINNVQSGIVYAYAISILNIPAASSAFRYRQRMYRRYVPL